VYFCWLVPSPTLHWCSKSTENTLTNQLVIASQVLSPALGEFFSTEL
jgi:hypothetical protein